MKSKPSTFLIALFSFGFGVFSLYAIFSTSDYIMPFVDSCMAKNATHKFVRVGGKNLDKFLCFITPFFEAALLKSGSIGPASFMFVGQMLFGFTTFATIESGRKSATGFVYGAFLVFMIGQLVGIAAAMPCFWLPSFIINQGRTHELKDRMVSPQVVFLSFVSNGLISLVGSLMLLGDYPFFYHSVTAFQLVPLVTVIVILFTRSFGYPFEAKVGLDGVNKTRLLYAFNAVSCAVTWYVMCFSLWKSGFTLETITSISKASPESCALFLIYDGGLLSMSGAITVTYLDGFAGLLKYLFLSILLGPGSSFLICAYGREGVLALELKKLEKSESSKKTK